MKRSSLRFTLTALLACKIVAAVGCFSSSTENDPVTKALLSQPQNVEVDPKSIEPIVDDSIDSDASKRKIEQDAGLAHTLRAANQGDPNAQFLLGMRYLVGDEVGKDRALAGQWFLKAARQDHPEAARRVGFNCRFGLDGFEEDPEQAVSWYRIASDHGDLTAIGLLSSCYEDGIGVEKDVPKAMELLKKAARLGNTKAQFLLGKEYVRGEHLAKDFEKAVSWFLRAAKGNETLAKIELAKTYDSASGNPSSIVNDSEAAFWYREALGDKSLKSLRLRSKLEASLREMYRSGRAVNTSDQQVDAMGFENLPPDRFAYKPENLYGVFLHLTEEGRSGPFGWKAPDPSNVSFVKLMANQNKEFPHALRFVFRDPNKPGVMMETAKTEFQVYKIDDRLRLFFRLPSGLCQAASMLESEMGFYISPFDSEKFSLVHASPDDLCDFLGLEAEIGKSLFDRSQVAELRHVWRFTNVKADDGKFPVGPQLRHAIELEYSKYHHIEFIVPDNILYLADGNGNRLEIPIDIGSEVAKQIKRFQALNCLYVQGGKPVSGFSYLVETLGNKQSMTRYRLGIVFKSKESPSSPSSVVVESVMPYGPAADAGLSPGDCLVSMDNEECLDVPSFLSSIEKLDGSSIEIGFYRDGKEQSVKLVPSPVVYGVNAITEGG